MLGRILRRVDKLHAVLLGLCVVLVVLVLQHNTKTDAGDELMAFEVQQYRSAIRPVSNGSLVQYNKNVPLLWIGGVPRSGTTLIRAMLDAHPDIRCGEETRVIPRMLGVHAKTVSEKTEMARLAEAHITKDLLSDALATYILTIIAGHGEPAPLLCNKDPFAIRSLPLILTMFPNSKFILMLRDGRAVSHSIITRHITIKGFDITTYDGSLKNWNQAITSMYSVCTNAGPERCLPVYYERLVMDPKPQMERILKFAGMAWDDIVLHHEEAIGKRGGISLSRREPSTNQVNKAVNTQALLSWYGKIPNNILAAVDSIAPMLRKLGYDTSVLPPDYARLLDPKAEKSLYNVL